MDAGNNSNRRTVVFIITIVIIAIAGILWRFGLMPSKNQQDRSPVTITVIESGDDTSGTNQGGNRSESGDSIVKKSKSDRVKNRKGRKNNKLKEGKNNTSDIYSGYEIFEDSVSVLQN